MEAAGVRSIMSAQSYLPIIKGQKTPCYDKCRVVNKCRVNYFDFDSLTSERKKKEGPHDKHMVWVSSWI